MEHHGTTTMRVRRSTQERLAREAELAGRPMIDVLDAAADLLEERRMLTSMDQAYREHGADIRAEAAAWDATIGDGLTSES
jgi:hypothetical protein